MEEDECWFWQPARWIFNFICTFLCCISTVSERRRRVSCHTWPCPMWLKHLIELSSCQQGYSRSDYQCRYFNSWAHNIQQKMHSYFLSIAELHKHLANFCLDHSKFYDVSTLSHDEAPTPVLKSRITKRLQQYKTSLVFPVDKPSYSY